MTGRLYLYLLFNLIIVFFLLPCPYSAASCNSSIHFPFRLNMNSSSPSSCACAGYPLSCNQNFLTLTLPNSPSSSPFVVHGIDYTRRRIWLNDPAGCLPYLLLTLNLSQSPFSAVFYQDFTLFRCPNSTTLTDHFISIDCLSDANHTVFSTSSKRGPHSSCVHMADLSVPVNWDIFQPAGDLRQDIRLTWGFQKDCEWQCDQPNSNTNSTSHFGGQRLPKSARYAIIVGAGIPAVLCLLGLTCYVTSRMKQCCCRDVPPIEYSMAVVPDPPLTTTKSGLDSPTIESYPKTILGESCRLPNPEDSICSICLSEYMPKETLRSIPECQHSFHARCIDKWLRHNPSCPICRNSPNPLSHLV